VLRHQLLETIESIHLDCQEEHGPGCSCQWQIATYRAMLACLAESDRHHLVVHIVE
jgi:hypothetical protein